MVAQRHLCLAAVQVARVEHHLAVAVEFEPVPRQHVEHSIRAVAQVGVVAAALSLHGIDVLGIDLRPDVRRDLCIGNRHAIDQPACLVAAAHVQHVVRHVRAGHVIGNHLRARGAVSARRLVDRLPRDQRRWSYSIGRTSHPTHNYRLCRSRHLQGNVQHRIRARCYGQCQCCVGESACCNRQPVHADRSLRQFEFAIGIRRGVQRKIGISGLERHRRARYRPVLRVVNHSVQCGKHRRRCGKGSGQQERCHRKIETSHERRPPD